MARALRLEFQRVTFVTRIIIMLSSLKLFFVITILTSIKDITYTLYLKNDYRNQEKQVFQNPP